VHAHSVLLQVFLNVVKVDFFVGLIDKVLIHLVQMVLHMDHLKIVQII